MLISPTHINTSLVSHLLGMLLLDKLYLYNVQHHAPDCGGGGEEPIIAATKYEFRNNLGSSLDSMNLPGMEPSM